MAVVVARWSSSAALAKAVALPLLLALLVVASATGSSSAGLDDGPAAVAQSGGRFSESPVGRKLLALKLCPGSAPNYNCSLLLPLAKNATCCTDILGNQVCYDVGGFLVDKCGSCTTRCKFGEVCCSGVCANLLTNKNNCGSCGRQCRGRCTLGFCNY